MMDEETVLLRGSNEINMVSYKIALGKVLVIGACREVSGDYEDG